MQRFDTDASSVLIRLIRLPFCDLRILQTRRLLTFQRTGVPLLSIPPDSLPFW